MAEEGAQSHAFALAGLRCACVPTTLSEHYNIHTLAQPACTVCRVNTLLRVTRQVVQKQGACAVLPMQTQTTFLGRVCNANTLTTIPISIQS